jgi:hypothetical protein
MAEANSKQDGKAQSRFANVNDVRAFFNSRETRS